MLSKTYPVSFEIAGPAAIFTRPDSGATFVSYPAPTYSALKGMFECVARWESAYIRPVAVEICAPVRYLRYATNYGGPLRKRGTANYQFFATILIDVCYKVLGEVAEAGAAPERNNHLHALQEVFERRLKGGQLYRTPCLGWSEFVPSYFGPLRSSTQKLEAVDLTIPSMLHSVFDQATRGKVGPKYCSLVRVEKGVLRFAE